ncbi:SMC family ATPase [Siminovitchia fortis]|uniref:Nuclease SbcCD subunit C n=1 Tax=Siminovitchia fortis TaxID=254758 RepID=A0A443IUC3_9BACI|nr:SMC family ATPase [Siminovitchia fortis]RWR11672.1 SMC family ATPase [Siminovitchia fortis]WHY83199.1 SMC family ATPase [Siminovitchia fortis]
MRPLKLKMQAFGPYAGLEIIDFTQLENRTMFVISGKTGAGKTSIFDGISFAIYGKASGEDRNGADLRSHFAKDELPTEVSLEFQLRDKIYYICRSPQQERKKARGDGYTTVNAKAELYLVDESGSKKLLAANVRDTDEKIKEIIQLDANQFRQILMIPQGDFRKLLTSDSKEKEIILQRLFHTGQFKKIEEKLKEKASLLKNEVEGGIGQRSQKLREIFTNGNDELEAALAEPAPSDTVILPLLETITGEMKQASAELEKKIEIRQKHRDEAKRKVDEAENILNEMNSRDALKKQKALLVERKTLIDEKKIAVDLARRAGNLAHQENICQRLKKEIDDRTAKKGKMKEELAFTIKAKNAADEKLKREEKNRDKREKLHAELTRLESLREDVLSFSKRKADLKRLEQKAKQCRKTLDETKRKAAEWGQAVEKQQDELNKLRQLQDKNIVLKEEKLRIEQIIGHLHKLAVSMEKEQAANTLLVQREKELKLAKSKAEDASETLKHIEEKWYSGHAAILAGTLESGCPCPVCGSSEHPAPANTSGDYVSEEDFEAAKKDAHVIEEQLAEIRQEWMKAKADADLCAKTVLERVDEAKIFLPDLKLEETPLHLQKLEGKKQELSNQLESNTVKTDKIPEKEARITQLAGELKDLNSTLDKMAEKEREAANQFMETKVALQSLAFNLPEGLETKEQYENRLSVLQKEIKKLDDALKQAQEDCSKLNEQLAAQKMALTNIEEDIAKQQSTLNNEREKFLNQLHQEGFTNYAEYAESKKDSAWIQNAEEEIKSYGEEYRSVTDRLKDFDERLKGIDRPDIEKLNVEFREQEKMLLSMNNQLSTLLMNIQKNEGIRLDVQRLNEQIKELEKQYEIVGHLSDITRGQNTYRLTFERFVLASFLDDILAAANGRLLKMTSGRYQLLRKKERSKGNVQSGLELLVFDQYTGQERHVKTLSGGESFKAALTLALGLADVVQEHAGGVSLETMFIDEGFGTLDPESLDQAIEALMEIQSSGRLVGIISHVPELKERIDARLEVLAGQSGSSTEFVFLS